MPAAPPPKHHFHPRDPGPPTPAEQTIIARILISHGYPAPPPRAKARTLVGKAR